MTRKAADLARGAVRRWRDFDAARDYPLAFVHREAWPLIAYAPERRLERQRTKWVYDFDDAVFLPNVSEANRLFVKLKPFDQPARLAARARAVSAGNQWLAGWARRQRGGFPADDVQVIPTVVDTEIWRPRSREAGPPRLVWIGSPTTVGFLDPIRPALARLARRHPGLELHVIGASFAADGVQVIVHPWSLETEVDLAGRCDVGLSPLPDTDWARGKCGLKLIQYMALGISAVASPVGVHPEIVAHGENGMLAATPEAFEEAVHALLCDPSLRCAQGRAARETVLARYSVDAVAPRLAALLERASES
jgi:glycosyltransferase involved in cell wall biosynthesis